MSKSKYDYLTGMEGGGSLIHTKKGREYVPFGLTDRKTVTKKRKLRIKNRRRK